MNFMRIHAKEATLYRFSPIEKRLLEKLSKNPQEVSDLARLVRHPRTSVWRALGTLHKRGLARQTLLHKRRKGWVGVGFAVSSRVSYKPDSEITIYRGKEELMELAQLAFHFNSERIIWLRGSRVWDGYNKQKLRGRFLFLLKLFARKGVVIEEIASSRALELDLQYGGREMTTIQKRLLRVLSVVPDRNLNNFYSDIMVFRDSVSFMNWYDEVALLIRNPDLVRLFKQLLEYVGETGSQAK